MYSDCKSQTMAASALLMSHKTLVLDSIRFINESPSHERELHPSSIASQTHPHPYFDECCNRAEFPSFLSLALRNAAALFSIPQKTKPGLIPNLRFSNFDAIRKPFDGQSNVGTTYVYIDIIAVPPPKTIQIENQSGAHSQNTYV